MMREQHDDDHEDHHHEQGVWVTDQPALVSKRILGKMNKSSSFSKVSQSEETDLSLPESGNITTSQEAAVLTSADHNQHFEDATDDDIILSLISNTLFLWGALFVLVVSIFDLTDLKLQSDLPLIIYDDNTIPSHIRTNKIVYNTASLLGPIFYFLNAIFDYLWALFVKEKTSLYAKYLGRMDPVWDVLYGVFFGLGAVMDIMNASLSIAISNRGGSEDDFELFFTIGEICSTFFYLVSGLFFLFAVEFTTCKHPVKLIILLGDCLFLTGSAMDFVLSLISDPDIVIEDAIKIAHGHILSNAFWTINAALYLIADIIVWCTQKKPMDHVDELVGILMSDLSFNFSPINKRRYSSRSASGRMHHHARTRRATMATVDDITNPSRSRLSSWEQFMSRPITISTTTTTRDASSGDAWPKNLFLSRPRVRRATMATVDEVNELELIESDNNNRYEHEIT